jgi:DASH complex subunit Dad2
MMGSTTPHSSSTQPQPSSRFLPPHILTSRIAEKQAEYESLSQLRDLSAGLASQMENLEQKLNCLADGTESTLPSQVLCFGNWTILIVKVLLKYWRIGRMCFAQLIWLLVISYSGRRVTVLMKVKLASLGQNGAEEEEEERTLPEMLVRIPVNDPSKHDSTDSS